MAKAAASAYVNVNVPEGFVAQSEPWCKQVLSDVGDLRECEYCGDGRIVSKSGLSVRMMIDETTGVLIVSFAGVESKGGSEGQTPLVEFEWWSNGAAIAFQFRKNLPILQFTTLKNFRYCSLCPGLQIQRCPIRVWLSVPFHKLIPLRRPELDPFGQIGC